MAGESHNAHLNAANDVTITADTVVLRHKFIFGFPEHTCTRDVRDLQTIHLRFTERKLLSHDRKQVRYVIAGAHLHGFRQLVDVVVDEEADCAVEDEGEVGLQNKR